MTAALSKLAGATKKNYLNSRRRVPRGFGEEYGADGKRRRRTNSRRGFLSQMSDGYRGN